MKSLFLSLFLFFALYSCNTKTEESNIRVEKPVSVKLKKHDLSYFSGEAEICVYDLEKARYDDIHKGEAILIQVKEPFLPDIQVKSDNRNNKKAIQVLKSNYIERFTTGVYDYSIMSSTFTPSSYDVLGHSLKTTCSLQDWCGQSFMQLNNREEYEVKVNSYFESEGDKIETLKKVWQEDEFFNLSRMDKEILPTGEFEILPKLSFLATQHVAVKVYKAIGSIEKLNEFFYYSYSIPELQKEVLLVFDENNHNRIVEFTETYPTVFDGEQRSTIAKLKAVKKIDYWSKNGVEDLVLRDSLLIR